MFEDEDGLGDSSPPHLVDGVDSESEEEEEDPRCDFLSDEDLAAFERCKIHVTNGGIYSEDAMSRAIETAAQEHDLLEALPTKQAGSEQYQQYRVKNGSESKFFHRDLYTTHDPENGSTTPNPIPEETVLFEIEAMRRSKKGLMRALFMHKETGGMVVFGLWFKYTLLRLLKISDMISDQDIPSEHIEYFTAVKIMKSLLAFIATGIPILSKPAHLRQFSTKYGVDWMQIMRNAHKVIECHCRRPIHGVLHRNLADAEGRVRRAASSHASKFNQLRSMGPDFTYVNNKAIDVMSQEEPIKNDIESLYEQIKAIGRAIKSCNRIDTAHPAIITHYDQSGTPDTTSYVDVTVPGRYHCWQLDVNTECIAYLVDKANIITVWHTLYLLNRDTLIAERPDWEMLLDDDTSYRPGPIYREFDNDNGNLCENLSDEFFDQIHGIGYLVLYHLTRQHTTVEGGMFQRHNLFQPANVAQQWFKRYIDNCLR